MAIWREQGISIPSDDSGLALEGAWQAGQSQRGGVIAAPHPLMGGSLDHPVCNEIAFGLFKRGLCSVRFNWRGVGASQGTATDDPSAAIEDFTAAVDHLEATIDGEIIAAGYSFGAAVALRASLLDERVTRLILVSPPVQMIRDLPISELGRPLHVIVGDRDAYAPAPALLELVGDITNARLEVIPHVDHFFGDRGLADLTALVCAAVG